MSRLSLATGGPTIADRFFPRGVVTDLVLLGSGAAFVALCAQLTIPLWPVSITAQTFGVLLVGAALGAIRGALALTVYFVVGLLGAPVFSDGASGIEALLDGSGGFLIGFIGAAALAGWLAQRGWDRRLPTGIAAMALSAVVPYFIGLPWLAVWLGGVGAPNDPLYVLQAGVFPFVIGAVVKLVVAALLLRVAWYRALRVQVEHPDDD